MTEPSRPATGRLPDALRETLERGVRRLRRVALWRGVLAVTAFAALAFLAVMAVDAATVIFSRTLRWLLSGAAFLVAGLAAHFFLVRPWNCSATWAVPPRPGPKP